MTDTLWKAIAICLIGALLAVFLKKTSPDVALVLAACVCVAVLAVVVRGLEEVWQFLTESRIRML